MSDAARMRVGDQERDRAVAMLGEHFVEGRLTKDEYDQRSAQALAARFQDELAALFRDLPATPVLHPTAQAPASTRQPVPSLGSREPGWVQRGSTPIFLWALPIVGFGGIVLGLALGAPWLIIGMMWVVLGGFGRHHHHARRRSAAQPYRSCSGRDEKPLAG